MLAMSPLVKEVTKAVIYRFALYATDVILYSTNRPSKNHGEAKENFSTRYEP